MQRKECDPQKGKENLKQSLFDLIINALLSDLNRRVQVYRGLDSKFSFLVNPNSMSDEEIAIFCKAIATEYSRELNEEELMNDMSVCQKLFHFRKYES